MKIAVLGHGTVGSGVCELLWNKAEEISAAAGTEIELGYVTDIKDIGSAPYREKFTADFSAILSDPEVKIVAECIGGLDPAYFYIKSALENNKSVVTSNKELVSEKGFELLSIARAHNVNFLFEASVGGGIPLIHTIYSSMNTAGITEISGILNGTTNYILTKMLSCKSDYYDALSDAQKLGYAESDPSADVLGTDSCRKIAILASLVWKKAVFPNQISTKGIEKISVDDILSAEKCGFSIKLIARAKLLDNKKIFAKVSPYLVKNGSPLSTVSDVFNAVLINAQTTGEVLFYGKGAGKMPTASAVISDIIECAKTKDNIKNLFWEIGAQNSVSAFDEIKERYFIRTDFDISNICPSEKISENVFITPALNETEISVLIKNLDEHGKVLSIIPLFE